MEKFINFLNATSHISGHGVTGSLKNYEAIAAMGLVGMFFGIIIIGCYTAKLVSDRKLLRTVKA